MIIERISIDNSAFVFGLNTFVALIFQTILSILVTKIAYLNDIQRQVIKKADLYVHINWFSVHFVRWISWLHRSHVLDYVCNT
jgi:5-bromo-4-chloroindolyl phosphate hydrolysis protein